MADDFQIDIPQYAPGQPQTAQLAYVNNNPGNIKFAGQPDAEPGDKGFAKFKSPEAGYSALRDHIEKRQGLTLEKYLSAYAPPTDGNDTEGYIRDASKVLGANRNMPLAQLDRDALAKFQAQRESSSRVVHIGNDPDDPWKQMTAGSKTAAPTEDDPWATAPGGATPPPTTFSSGYKEIPEDRISRIGKGILRGAGIDPTFRPDPQTQTWMNVIDHLKDGRYGDATKELGGALTDAAFGPAEGYVGNFIDQGRKVLGAIKDGRYDEALYHAGASIIPPLTGLADAPQHVRATGDLAGGVAQAVTSVALPELINQGVNKFGKEAPPLSDKDMVNQQLLKTVNERRAAQIAAPELQKELSEPDYQLSAKPLTEALDPQNAADFKDVQSRRLIPLLKAEEPLVGGFGDKATVVPRLRQALEVAKERNRQQFQPYVDHAEARGVRLSGDDVARAMKDSISDQVKTEHPDVATDLATFADIAYKGRTFTPSQFQNFIETNNAKLKAYFDAKGDVQNAQTLTQSQKAMTLAQQDAFHDGLYKALDPQQEGGNITELQKRYGALAEGSKALAKLEDTQARAKTTTGMMQALKANVDKWGKVVDLQHPVSGFSKLIPEETTEGKLVRAMKSYPKQAGLKDVPPAPPWDLSSPGDVGFTRQQGLDEQVQGNPSGLLHHAEQHAPLPLQKLDLIKTLQELDYPSQRKLFTEGITNTRPSTRARPTVEDLRKIVQIRKKLDPNGTP